MPEQQQVAVEQQSAEQQAPVAETTDAPEAGATEQQPQADAKPEDTAAEETKRALRGVQKRINELTRARHEAEEAGRKEAEAWRTRAQQLEQYIQQQQAQTQAPVFSGDYEAFARDVARYEAQQAATAALQAERQSREQVAQVQHQQAQRAAIQQQFVQAIDDVVAKGEAKFPGFVERITAGELPSMRDSPAFLAILDTGDAAPDILNYIANNPAKAHEIVSLSPVGQVKAIGRIEAALAQGRLVSNAPQPAATVGAAKPGAPKDPSQMNYDEFVKFRRKQIAARRN